MSPIFNTKMPHALALILVLGMLGCEIETTAYGTVKDAKTGLPIAGAHVVELAITNKKQELLCEGFTDSTGYFEMDAGPTNFGGRNVALYVFAEKDSLYGDPVSNNYKAVEIALRKR